MGNFAHSATSEDGIKPSAKKYFRDLVTFVALNFDAAFFDRAAGATRFLHLARELLFFGQTDADEVGDDGDGFSAAAGSLADDVHATAFFCWRSVSVHWTDGYKNGTALATGNMW